jgi:hypothetical protein
MQLQILLKKFLTFSLNPYPLISICLPISTSTEYPVESGYLSDLLTDSSDKKLNILNDVNYFRFRGFVYFS